MFTAAAQVAAEHGAEDASLAPHGWFDSSAVVDTLVRRFVGAWRDQFALHVKRKVRLNEPLWSDCTR